MLELSNLHHADGATHHDYRRGRGHASGNGKTAGKGNKGQKARSGAPRPGFEGGQMPLYRRLPKRGFTRPNAPEYVAIKVDALNRFEDGTEVTTELLKKTGVVKQPKDGIKILGGAELTAKNLTVKVYNFSASAKASIEQAGGHAIALRDSEAAAVEG